MTVVPETVPNLVRDHITQLLRIRDPFDGDSTISVMLTQGRTRKATDVKKINIGRRLSLGENSGKFGGTRFVIENSIAIQIISHHMLCINRLINYDVRLEKKRCQEPFSSATLQLERLHWRIVASGLTSAAVKRLLKVPDTFSFPASSCGAL